MQTNLPKWNLFATGMSGDSADEQVVRDVFLFSFNAADEFWSSAYYWNMTKKKKIFKAFLHIEQNIPKTYTTSLTRATCTLTVRKLWPLSTIHQGWIYFYNGMICLVTGYLEEARNTPVVVQFGTLCRWSNHGVTKDTCCYWVKYTNRLMLLFGPGQQCLREIWQKVWVTSRMLIRM